MTKAQATSKITVLMAVGDGSDQVITVPSQKWKEDVTRNSSGVETQVRFAYEVPGIVSTGPDKGDSVLKIFTIDYTTHTYAVRIWTMGGSDLKDVEQAYLSNPATPESLQTSSWSQVVGTATIEDQPAYVLHQTGSGGFSSTLWVNKYTLLPIEEVNHTYLGKQTSTYSYATVAGAGGAAAANLPAIPPGFTCTAAGHCDPTPGGSGN